jgi:hypothetical protein
MTHARLLQFRSGSMRAQLCASHVGLKPTLVKVF